MTKYPRVLKLQELIEKKSFFLFGPRSSGKTTLIRHQLPLAQVFNLLDADVFGRLTRRPKEISEGIGSPDQIIVIDEVQKLPSIVDEVQRVIQEKGNRFLLTGSSARKLKKGGANLLGGRAWEASLFPLCFPEIPEFDLFQYLNRGGLPHIYPSKDFSEELEGYSNLYLKEEIQAEALTRRVDHFARFLDVIALQNGEELNYEEIAGDCGVKAQTVKNYIEILVDTLMGFEVPAFRKTKKRKAITRSKFYLFDLGVTHALAARGEIRPKSELFGRAFEHFMMLELRAYLHYRRKRLPLQYWRTTSQYEVDCIVGQELALEFKSTDQVTERHLKSLKAMGEEKIVKTLSVVSLDPEMRKMGEITIYPWKTFLTALWADQIL